ncbi:MAG: nucleoid-associated protein YgaU, partial [Myxococcota bacterium]
MKAAVMTACAACLMLLVSLPAAAQFDRRDQPSITTLDSSLTKPPGTYVVQKEDTLWDLSDGVFGDPH